jgi:uncharacterized protein YcbK (DUF882 family)
MFDLLNRRALLKGGMALALGAALPDIGHADVAKSRLDSLVSMVDPVLKVHNVHTDETIDLRFFGPNGYDMQAIEDINWIMRDWRQREAIQVDERLIWALATLRLAARRAGHDGLIRLHSGYRTQATNDLLRSQGVNAAMRSFHLTARAADFSMEGIPTSKIAEYAHWLEIGGIGHYRNSFIHIDSGPYRQWNG